MSRRAPKISIGIPVYNGAAFLRETLQHLSHQTYSDFEIIISDNASDDATPEICQEFARADSRINYQRLAVNVGAIENFNRLIGLAQGKYFKWAAADDVCLPNFLEETLEIIESDPEVAWVHSQFGKVDKSGNVLSCDDPAAEGLAHSSDADQPRPQHDSSVRHKRFHGVLLGTTWCADIYGLIRKSVLDRTRPFPKCFGAEKVLLGELALWGKYREVPKTLFFQRVHSAAAGELTTRDKQEAYMVPNTKKKAFAATRTALLAGHLGSVFNVPMSVGERALSLAVVARYATQISKWPDLVRSEVLRQPFRRLVNRSESTKKNKNSQVTSTAEDCRT